MGLRALSPVIIGRRPTHDRFQGQRDAAGLTPSDANGQPELLALEIGEGGLVLTRQGERKHVEILIRSGNEDLGWEGQMVGDSQPELLALELGEAGLIL
jgi:hypothetical protein